MNSIHTTNHFYTNILNLNNTIIQHKIYNRDNFSIRFSLIFCNTLCYFLFYLNIRMFYINCTSFNKERIIGLYENNGIALTNIRFSKYDEIYIEHKEFNLHIDYLLPDFLDIPSVQRLYSKYKDHISFSKHISKEFELCINNSTTTKELYCNLIAYFAKSHTILNSKVREIYFRMKMYFYRTNLLPDNCLITKEHFTHMIYYRKLKRREDFIIVLKEYLLPLSIIMQKVETTQLYTRIIGYELLYLNIITQIQMVPHLFDIFHENIKEEFTDSLQWLDNLFNIILHIGVEGRVKSRGFYSFSLIMLHKTFIKMKHFLKYFYTSQENINLSEILGIPLKYIRSDFFKNNLLKNLLDAMSILYSAKEDENDISTNMTNKIDDIRKWPDIHIKDLNLEKAKKIFDMLFDKRFTSHDMEKEIFSK
ncbi:hypothetical protein SLOPH_1048 [Spraguea lophii 42_110]|uniref:Uncharacterized protein n=1 Tax=Spraguea lophii (strain 42_110) TaxID=1358809 RepID=S7WAA1_SPRLO|nr:hypothetical protein SLOPH_1048 [Spraguea lophii 42_110]